MQHSPEGWSGDDTKMCQPVREHVTVWISPPSGAPCSWPSYLTGGGVVPETSTAWNRKIGNRSPLGPQKTASTLPFLRGESLSGSRQDFCDEEVQSLCKDPRVGKLYLNTATHIQSHRHKHVRVCARRHTHLKGNVGINSRNHNKQS